MRPHHAFIDGLGIRAILNEFLERLVDSSSDEEIVWGEEIQRLLPAAVLLEKVEEPESTSMPVVREEGMRAFHKVYHSRHGQ